MTKTYNQLRRLQTFEERFEYLKLHGAVGFSTFGYDRYLNQRLYQSREWQQVRRDVMIRDDGCDIGIPDRRIVSRPVIHHINPITMENVENGDPCVFDLNNLILTSHNTHNAIHYGDESLLIKDHKPRMKGDTRLWRKT